MSENIKKQEFPDVAFMGEHKGNHVGDGIYKLEKPFRVSIAEWADDRTYADFVIAPNNYSDDFEACDVVYFANINYHKLEALVRELNADIKSEEEEFGVVYNSWSNREQERLGGIIVC